MSALFFIDSICTDTYTIIGEDAKHLSRSLRVSKGEVITLCDSNTMCHDCEITSVMPDRVDVRVINSYPCKGEPSVSVTLFQALTKGDKFDTIIQKSVELGVSRIVPVLTSRCISRPDAKQSVKKLERWQKIADAASMQSRRGKKVKISPICTLEQAIEQCKNTDCNFVFYEKGGKGIGELVKPQHKNINFFVGCEGGFEAREIEFLNNNFIESATLGNRILRTETAPLAALSVIMYITENM